MWLTLSFHARMRCDRISRHRPWTFPATLALWLCATTASAQSLPELVERAVSSDPLLAQAEANLASAKARRDAALAEHFPRFGVQGSDRLSGNIPDSNPELVGSVNVWAGGGVQAEYRGAGSDERYFGDKLAETRENLAYEVARLYINALSIQAQLAVGNRNRERHGQIVDNLTTVVRYDVGRQYDLLQAQSRKAQVETRLLTLESQLDAAQSQLARYTRLMRTDLVPLSLNTGPADEVMIAEHPSFLAQVEQVGRADADLDVAKAARWPRVNVESVLSEHGAARLAFNWDALNFGTGDKISAARQRKEAASSLLDATQLDLDVRRQTALVNFRRSEDRLRSALGLIDSSRQVTQAFEKQFQIARRSMVDLLNAYAELSSVESAAAQAEYERQAFALEYLHASARTEEGVRTSAATHSLLIENLMSPDPVTFGPPRAAASPSPSTAPPATTSPAPPPPADVPAPEPAPTPTAPTVTPSPAE